MTRLQAAGLLIVVAMSISCGGDSATPPTNPTPPTGNGMMTTISISASGVDLRTVTIAPGSRVRFVNNDSRAHEMDSDPHPSHEDCPELNQVGFLNPGQQRDSGNLVDLRACGFHDHANPGTLSLRGTITIRQ